MDLTRTTRCVLGVSLAVGVLVVLNQLQISFYLYYPQTTRTVLTSSMIDLYFFVFSSASVPASLVLSRRKLSTSMLAGIIVLWLGGVIVTVLHLPYSAVFLYPIVIYVAMLEISKSDSPHAAAVDMLVYTFAFFVLIESATLYYWAEAAVNPEAKIGLASEQLEVNLTFALYPLAVIMLVALLFAWLWVPVVTRLRPLSNHATGDYSSKDWWNMRLVGASLDLFVIVAMLLFFYPYLAGQTWIVGVDSYWRYLYPLKSLSGLPVPGAVNSSYHELYLFILYLIVGSGISSFSVVKFAPLILAIASAFVVFLVMRRAGWGFETAILSSLCTLLWIPTTLGIYAGIQANWFAFVLWLLFLSFYFLVKRWSAIILLIQSLISVFILLIHPWTWGVFVMSLLLTVLISWRSALRGRSVQGLFAALMFALPLGVAGYLSVPSLNSDLSNALGVYVRSLTSAGLISFGGPLSELFINWGSIFPPLLLLICSIGASSLPEYSGIGRNYLLGWIATWFIGSILIAPMGYNPVNTGISETGLWRMLYLSPLPILLALGMKKCLVFSKHLESDTASPPASRWLILLLSSLFVAFSALLFLASNPPVRLAIIIAAVAGVFLIRNRFCNCRILSYLVAALVLLIVVNAAYRSLYPLLLDPHSLFLSS